MTEYEMAELLHNDFDTLWETSQMYFTLVSAYLVVAYLVGSKLTPVQYLIINVLYLFWVAGVIQTQIFTGIGAMRIARILASEEGGVAIGQLGAGAAMQFGIYSFTIVMVCGVFASLFFMQSIRNTKTE